MKKGVCIVTLSDNYDHQEVAFSMFNALYTEYNVFNIGLINQKNPRSPKTKHSFYFDAPRRPVINKKTFDFITLRKIIKKINSLDIEYIYFESEHIWNAFIMLFIRKDVKKVEVIHDVIPHSDSKGKKLANKVTCKLADYVLIRNQMYKKDVHKLYKVNEENIIVMPLWRFYPPKNIDSSCEYFLFFGRIRKYKGLDNMIKIAEFCKNINFCVVGSPDNESMSDVEKLKNMSNVTVVDREVDDKEMENYFRKAKAVLLPYTSATQSGVIVDSYKYSRPVIAYNVGAVKEQIVNNETGFLVDENNLNEFINKIKYFDSLNLEDLKKMQNYAYNFGYVTYSTQKSKDEFIKNFL